MNKNSSGKMKEKSSNSSSDKVMDGSDITQLVENEKVFSNFVDHKFQELDTDCDGKLSVKELQPAVADIGAALGLPAQGTNPESDYIYTEVLNEFTHGKLQKISKPEFKEVLSDFLLGMAAGLKRDPVVILRIDGEDLHEFVKSLTFEQEMLSIFSEIGWPDGSLKDYIIKAFKKLTVDHGMPPATDPWVMSNVVEPALECLGDALQQPISQDTFLAAFKKAAESMVQLLKEQPAIVAHSNGFCLTRYTQRATWDNIKGILGVALDSLAASADLPPLGAIDQMDDIMNEALKMVGVSDGKVVKEDEFKKLLAEVLGSIMLQLEGNSVSVSINSIVHEPVGSSSTLLHPSSP
ncbi:hypothetical protein Sango_0538600 [Sesamum angolense]|uniref:EF-hand domain-containing protein n=1 Tax=Sesamum angolense TaxID=2727404 RepID=A0AAE2C196_9LAMI|nr:hypothetical protein Sango_0538600 [Sesamum angolense]